MSHSVQTDKELKIRSATALSPTVKVKHWGHVLLAVPTVSLSITLHCRPCIHMQPYIRQPHLSTDWTRSFIIDYIKSPDRVRLYQSTTTSHSYFVHITCSALFVSSQYTAVFWCWTSLLHHWARLTRITLCFVSLTSNSPLTTRCWWLVGTITTSQSHKSSISPTPS